MEYKISENKRLYDVKYISNKSSNSSMYYEGKYEGDVTSQEIVQAIGDGSWGHRGPTFLTNNTFTYVKQTD